MIRITKMAMVTPAMRATGDDFPSVPRSWPGSRRATTGSYRRLAKYVTISLL